MVTSEIPTYFVWLSLVTVSRRDSSPWTLTEPKFIDAGDMVTALAKGDKVNIAAAAMERGLVFMAHLVSISLN
jgi:hypothetical protein